MFVFLSKLLPIFIYPLGLAIGLLGLALLFNRRRSWQNAAILLAIAILWLGGNRWVSGSLARSLEWRYLPEGELPAAEAIVLLGGGTDPEEYPRRTPELNSAGDRVLYGAYLYQQGNAPLVLLSGGRVNWEADGSGTPAHEMAEIMQIMGVPEEALLLQNRSQNTYEDALYSAELLREQGITRVLLVTSAMHMPRSVALFEHQGIQVIPAPTDFKITQKGWDSLFNSGWEARIINFFPDVNNLNLTTAVMKEYIGMWVYRWRGWM